MSTEADAAADARRRRAHPWRRWYSLKVWKERRARQLHKQPWCEACKRHGRTRKATVANHRPPHRGDWKLFIHGPLESLCKTCHDSATQREELEGFSRALDDDGWPVDPHHPFNVSEARHDVRDPNEPSAP